MSNLILEQAKELDKNQNDAINNLKRFNYAYTPVPINPFPDSMTDIKKYVNITPIGTYASNNDGFNPIADYMIKLPDKQTPETCIVNAAMLKTRTLANTPFNNPPVVGTIKDITKNVKSRQLIRNTEEVIKKEKQKQTFYKNVSKTGTKNISERTKVYINGLHFRATSNGSGYMGDNPNYFNQNPDKIEIDTSKIDIYTDDLYLPTNFSNLENATRTNATNNKSVYSISHNVECVYTPSRRFYDRQSRDVNKDRHFFAVEWSGFFKPNVTGQWLFATDSDDVSFLWVESDNIKFDNGVFTSDNTIVDNRGLHGMQYRTSDDKNITLNMTKDNFYRIKIQFSENGGGYNMIVTARCKTSGSVITDFNGFFFAEVTKMVTKDVPYTYIEYNVPYEQEVIVDVKTTNVSYNEGNVETRTVSMGDMFNPTYSINDINAVYVSMVKDPTVETGNPAKYDCYISNSSNVANLNTVFNQANDSTPIFNVIDIWKSNSQGSVYDTGYCSLNSEASLLLDDTTYVQGLQDTDITNIMSGNVKDEIPYMYIGETMNGDIVIPSIILVKKSSNIKKTINILTDSTFNEIMKMCKDKKISQFSNKLWISQESNILAYNKDNESNKPEMGIIYKITNNVGLISNNQMFRLILKNGKLTLQMCINPTKLINNDEKLKYTEKVLSYAGNPSAAPQNLTPNTFSLLKIDTDHRINSINLIDKSENKSYYVPDQYTTYNNKYSTYINMFPSINRIKNGYVTDSNQCKTDCDNSTDCRAYYSYDKGRTKMCTLVGGTAGSTDVNNFPDAVDPQLFNPRSSDPDVTTSSLSIKNKTVKPSYNDEMYGDPNSLYKISNVSFNRGNSTIEQPRTFYPDQTYDNTNKNCTVNPDNTLNCDPVFEQLKELVRIRSDEKSKKLSVPANINFLNIENNTKLLDIDKIVDTTIENYTNIREAYTPFRIYNRVTDNISNRCNNPVTASNSNGLCDIVDKLNQVNTLQDDINTRSDLLIANKNVIKSKVSNIDTTFQTLSDINNNNKYQYDFNDYDDKPDISMTGAIERDTNVLLLYENNIYIIGTIITTSLAILGIILSRS